MGKWETKFYAEFKKETGRYYSKDPQIKKDRARRKLYRENRLKEQPHKKRKIVNKPKSKPNDELALETDSEINTDDYTSEDSDYEPEPEKEIYVPEKEVSPSSSQGDLITLTLLHL